MPDSIARRVSMVGGLAYAERVHHLASALTVTLQAEKDNRYFPHAIAVLAGGEKVGYVAPEVARRYHAAMLAYPAPVTCPARRATAADLAFSGVELVLDFSALPVEPAP